MINQYQTHDTPVSNKIVALVLLTLALSLTSACSKKDSSAPASQHAATSADKPEQSTTQSEATSAVSSASSDFDSAYAAADKLRLEAAALEYEWSNTASYLLEAKDEMAAGNSDLAMALISKAHKQGELAIAQAKTEASAWKTRVPK